MAIEPLSSAMTYQAQTTQQAKPVQKTVVEDTEVSTPEKVSAYDATTVKVAETEKQDSQSGQENSYINQQQANNEKIRKAVEQLNKNMSHSEAVFGFHDATNRVTIKIIDKDTKEVIKELPPEKTLDMIAKVWEMAGILVDEKREEIIHMALRMTGMMSGLDTESIIQELVSAKKTKVDSKKKEQTKLEWKQDAGKELNTKLKSLQSKHLANMRFASSDSKKTTKVSNSSAVSVITGENAVNGVQSLKIEQLANTGYLTGA